MNVKFQRNFVNMSPTLHSRGVADRPFPDFKPSATRRDASRRLTMAFDPPASSTKSPTFSDPPTLVRALIRRSSQAQIIEPITDDTLFYGVYVRVAQALSLVFHEYRSHLTDPKQVHS